MTERLGQVQSNRVINQTRSKVCALLEPRRKTLDKKLKALNPPDPAGSPNTCGSRRITASTFKFDLQEHQSSTRPHRQSRHKNRQKKKRRKRLCCMKPNDSSELDPIVLASNVVLTEDQKSITRLSSKFAPAPRSPLDICDLLVSLERFAEHLCWH